MLSSQKCNVTNHGFAQKEKKEEKKGAKKSTTQKASKQFYCYPKGNETENNLFCLFALKGISKCINTDSNNDNSGNKQKQI